MELPVVDSHEVGVHVGVRCKEEIEVVDACRSIGNGNLVKGETPRLCDVDCSDRKILVHVVGKYLYGSCCLICFCFDAQAGGSATEIYVDNLNETAVLN